MKHIGISGILFITGLLLLAGCAQQEEKIPVRVLAAGSLLQPFSEAEMEFEAANPGYDIEVEGHGSIQVIRQVTDLHRRVDVVAVADASLIPDLMYHPAEGSGENFTDFYTPFATNEMVIAFTNRSRYSREITSENWPDVLERPGVRVGISNPMLDAAGYRALMVIQLAEHEYRDPLVFDRIMGAHFTPPLNVTVDGDNTVITLPEIMRPSDDSVVIRDGSIYLLSLLEAGGIDYAFEYRSVAESMGLSYIRLPPSLNLGDREHANEYEKIKVVLGFQRFSSIGKERIGQPIIYAVTIPSNAPHPEGARRFMEHVITESGRGRAGWPSPLPGVEPA